MTLGEKMIVTQDGNIYNLRHIVRIYMEEYPCDTKGYLYQIVIEDTTREIIEIYRGTKEECKYALGRISERIASDDALIKLDYL